MNTKTWIETSRRSSIRDAVVAILRSVFAFIARSLERAAQRRQLVQLSDHQLRDLGLSRSDVAFETKKPLWRL